MTNKPVLCLGVLLQTQTAGFQVLGVPRAAGSGPSHLQLCKPFPEHVERHAQIVKELKERDEHDMIQGRESVKRGNLTIRWTWKCLVKRLVVLAHSAMIQDCQDKGQLSELDSGRTSRHSLRARSSGAQNLGYHQDVCQGAGACRHGLVLHYIVN